MGNGVELATAYVTLAIEGGDVEGGVRRSLSGVESEAARTGDAAGKKLGDGMSSSFKSGAKKVSALVAGIGAVAIGGALAKGLADSFNADALNAKLTAQLGLSAGQSAKAGHVAGTLFGQNYGTGMEQINEAIRNVIADIGGMRGASDEVLSAISAKALNTANIFDQDLGGVTRAVGQLMKTGLAKNASQAMDIVTAGFQKGADKSGDFLDTLNEYGTQFRKVGIDGVTATGLISQGLQGGARDADLVADAIKEFSIRAIDGSKLTSGAFKSLGLDAEAMQKQIAGGGPGGADGPRHDPGQAPGDQGPGQAGGIATALFGTQAEDLGAALFKLDPSKAAAGLGKVKGAAEQANKAFNDTPTAVLQGFVRQIQQGLVDVMANHVIPLFQKVAPAFQSFAAEMKNGTGAGGALAAVLGTVGSAVAVVAGFLNAHRPVILAVVAAYAAWKTVTLAMAVVGAAQAAWVSILTAAITVNIAVSKAAATASKVWAAGQWLLNAALTANPIGLVVVAIGLLVAAFILALKHSSKFRAIVTGAFTAIKTVVVGAVTAVVNFVKSHWKLLVAILLGPLAIAALLIAKNWSKIKQIFTSSVQAVVRVVKAGFNAVRTGITSAMNAAKSVVTSIWHGIVSIIQKGAATIVAAVRALPGKLKALGSLFKAAGRYIIDAFVNGLKNAAGVVSGIAGNVWDALRSLLNGAIDKINNALEFPIHVLGKDFNINPPDIPHLATGGRATSTTLAVIAEGREPESVLPDSVLHGLLERTAAAARGGGGGGPLVSIGVINAHDDKAVAREIERRQGIATRLARLA